MNNANYQDYNPAFDIHHIRKQRGQGDPAPLPAQTQPQATKPSPAAASSTPKQAAKRRGRPSKTENAANVQFRHVPREVWDALKLTLPFHELTSQADMLLAFMLFQLGPSVKFPTYTPPPHVAKAVKRMREVLSGQDTQALSATMGQVKNKLNRMDDELLRHRMLMAYLITVSTGLHAPGRVSTGDDLRLGHDNVISTSIAALQAFPQYKQVVKDHEGRPRKGASEQKEKQGDTL